MHELALMERVVAEVEARARLARVGCVRMQIGQLAGVLPETLEFCFALCTRGTALAGARLEIDEIHGLGLCRRCGGRVVMETASDRCPCGSAEIDVKDGRELRIATLELQ